MEEVAMAHLFGKRRAWQKLRPFKTGRNRVFQQTGTESFGKL
jgi:hypothetical protein